jgi:hypothetical protein
MANEGLTLVRDRWYTALTADVSAGATTLPVATNTVGGNVLPTPCIIMCGFEQMYATASTATTITVTRGFNSTAAIHAKGATVGIARVAAHHNDMIGILGSGGAGVMRKIANASGTGASGVLEFASIPSTYRSLMVIVTGRSDGAVAGTDIRMTFETSPTAGAYDYQRVRGLATAVTANENIGASDWIEVGTVPGNAATANAYGGAHILIPEYATTGMFKPVRSNALTVTIITSGGIGNDDITGVWESTAAIDRIRLTLGSGNWTTTSRATLYGIPG